MWPCLCLTTSIHVHVVTLYRFNVYVANFVDPTLRVESLVGVMEKVTSDEGRRRKVWERVLEWKPVSYASWSYLDEVYSKCTADEEKTLALAEVYINSRPESSWQHLLQTLYHEGELAAAKKAKSFLQQNRGDNCIVHVNGLVHVHVHACIHVDVMLTLHLEHCVPCAIHIVATKNFPMVWKFLLLNLQLNNNVVVSPVGGCLRQKGLHKCSATGTTQIHVRGYPFHVCSHLKF